MAKSIIQQALGIGVVPTNVVVNVDGVQIFSGAVPTVEISPEVPATEAVDAWSWETAGNFWGEQTMTITVQNGGLFVCHTWMNRPNAGVDPVRRRLLPARTQDGETYYDPFSNVTIDGAPVPVARVLPTYDGQWTYFVSEGEVFSCTVIIQQPAPS